MSFLQRRINLPFRPSAVPPLILSHAVLLVFTIFCFLQVTEGVSVYQELRQKDWWHDCPTDLFEDREPSLYPNDLRSVCLEKKEKANFFLTEGVTNFLIFLTLLITLHLFSKWEATSAIIHSPRLPLFSWLIIFSVYLAANFLLPSEYLSSFVWRFGRGYSVVTLYYFLRHPRIRRVWWWVSLVLTSLLCLVFILTALLSIAAETVIPLRY